MTTNEELFEDLGRVRTLLVSSPLASSLEQLLTPLGRAVSTLREPALRERGGLPLAARDRLVWEVAGIGQLLDSLGHWLKSQGGAISPTYNRQAEVEPAMATGPAWGRERLVVEG